MTVPINRPVTRPPDFPAPMADEAFYGLPGTLIRRMAPWTEADPGAMLAQFLVAFGNMLGRGAYWPIGGSRNYTNEFMLIIGPTARGRKGTGWDMVEHVLRLVDNDYIQDNKKSGIVSGEALVWRLRDDDGGPSDKRSLEMQGEFSGTLKLMGKDGAILSQVVRDLWDGKPVATESKTMPARCAEPHLSFIGHITEAELARYTTATELANGFINRFFFVASYMTQILPFPADVEKLDLGEFVPGITKALDFGRQPRAYTWTDQAAALWPDLYDKYGFPPQGIWGEATSRGPGHIFRVAMLFAILDLSERVAVDHLNAAVAIWEHSRSAALYVFGDALGDPGADVIWGLIRDVETGLSATDLQNLLGRNKSKKFIQDAINTLRKAGRIRDDVRPAIDGKGSKTVPVIVPVNPTHVRPTAAQREAEGTLPN